MRQTFSSFRTRLGVIVLVGLLDSLPGMAADQAADFLWARQFGKTAENAGLGLAVDKEGNIFVTGFMGLKQHQSLGTHAWSVSGGEIFLAKYNTVGKLLWLQKASGNGTDAGVAVAVDEDGNAFITGYFAETVRFGSFDLKATESARSAGHSPPDMFVAKYITDGKVLWVRKAGGDHLDQGYGIATDKGGNVYVTGYFQGKAAFSETELTGNTDGNPGRNYDDDYGDMFIAKYTSGGYLVWVRRAGVRAKNAGNSVAVGPSGHVYVTGGFGGGTILFGDIKVASTNLCNFIVQYDRDGNILWAQPTAGLTFPGGNKPIVAVDKEDHAFVAGNFEESEQVGGVLLQQDKGMNKETFLLNYASDGKLLWGRQAGGICGGVAVDHAGNAFITGSFDESVDFGKIHVQAGPHNPGISGTSLYVAKYSSTGEPFWVKSAGPGPTDQANGYGSPKAIAADQQGDIYITGAFGYSVTLGSTTLSVKQDFFGNAGRNAFLSKLVANPATESTSRTPH